MSDEPSAPPSRGVPAWALPAVGLVTFLLGAATGAALFALTPRDKEIVEVPRDPTQEELAGMCEPVVDVAVAEAATDLEEAQDSVRTLEAQVASKEAEVAELETEMARRAEKGRELATELKKAKAELASLEEQLSAAIQKQEELSAELTDTKEKLTAQIEETHEAKETSLGFQWEHFVADSELEVCEKGGRKKMGRCRETVKVSMSPSVKAAFEHCIRSDQEAPIVVEATRDAALPKFGTWLDQDERVTKGWYVLLCDPTLPEKPYWEEVPRMFDAAPPPELIQHIDPDDVWTDPPDEGGG